MLLIHLLKKAHQCEATDILFEVIKPVERTPSDARAAKDHPRPAGPPQRRARLRRLALMRQVEYDGWDQDGNAFHETKVWPV
jgi:hypothetical protein